MRNYQTSVMLDIGYRSSDTSVLLQVTVVLPVRKLKKLVIGPITKSSQNSYNVVYNEQDDAGKTEDYLLKDTFNIVLGNYSVTTNTVRLSDIADDQTFFHNYSVSVEVNKSPVATVINSGISDDADIDMMRGDVVIVPE